MDKPKRAKPKIIRWAPAALLILAQVVFVIWVLYQLTIRWSWTPFLVFEGLAIVMSVRVAYKQDNPSYKISWIIVLLLLQRKWYCEVDMSKYIAYIIDTLNHDMSISALLNPSDRIQRLLSRVR